MSCGPFGLAIGTPPPLVLYKLGRHLATFTRRPGSSLYTQTTASPPVTASGQVAASGQVFAPASRSSPASAPCSCRPLSHETLLWHHRLGHPSLPHLRGMASRTLVSGLPRSLPPLPPGPAPTCVPCVEGRQRTAPHSFEFPPTEAPLQTLHMDMWGPDRVRGQGHEHYFLLVVDDYSRYTTVFPLRRKGEVTELLIDWIRGARCQLSESFGSDLPVLRLHSDTGGEFSSDLLRVFCRSEGIRQTFTLPASPEENGIAERCIRMVMDVARTSMIHAAAPHFLWPFAVQYVAHQINLQPRVSLPETTPTLRWMGKVGDASVFRGPAPSGVSQVDPVKPVEVAVDSGAARGAEHAGAGPGGSEHGVVESKAAEPGGAESEGAEPRGAESERAESGGPPGVPSWREPLSPQRLREWYARRCSRAAGATGPAAGGASRVGATGGAAGAGAAGATGAGGTGAVGGPEGAGAAGPGGARTGGTGACGAAGIGVVGAGAVATGAAGARAAGGTGAGGAAGVVAGDPGAEGTGAVSAVSGGNARPRPYYVPLLEQVLGLPPSTSPTPPSLSPQPVQSLLQLQPASPLPGPSPYSRPSRGFTERREPESRLASPESRPASPESRRESPVRAVRTGRRVPRQRPPPVPGTHSMTLRPSTAPQRVPLPSPTASSLPDSLDPESDSLRTASPTVQRFLATVVTDPLIESTAALSPRLSVLRVSGGDLDAPDIPTPRCYVEAIEDPYSSQWQAAMDAEMASWKSTGTYVDEVPLPRANIGVDFFQTFSPTPKMTTLRVLLHVGAQCDYEHSLDFSTPFLQGSLHEEIWLRRPPGFTGSFPAGTLWSLRRPVYGLRQAPREWHDTLMTTLASLGFALSTADPSLFLHTDTTLPPFYVLVYVYDLIFATADTEALAHVKSELQKRHTCTDLGELTSYLGLRITRDRAQRTITLTHSHMVQQVLWRFGFTYSSPQSTPLPTGHSLSAPASNETVEPSGPYPELVGCLICEAEIYVRSMAAQELRWLTYLLTDLGELPRSPPVLYVDNKAMIALCKEHRLENRTKHIALHYFLARELQQRVQLRLAYVVFTVLLVSYLYPPAFYFSHSFLHFSDTVSCVLLGFPEDSSDYTFDHPPLHRFFDSCYVCFDKSVPYYVGYPCRDLPVPLSPLFLNFAPPPAPPVQPPTTGPAPSGMSHATPPPLVAPQVQPPSSQSSSLPTADPAGAFFRGENPGGASSRGAGVGTESVSVRGPGSGGESIASLYKLDLGRGVNVAR
ncbi:unnamed protein product [Closterium sp. NIES-54]